MRKLGSSLREHDTMPYPDMQNQLNASNRLVHDELHYNRAVLTREHENMVANLIDEQRNVYNTIMDAVNSDRDGKFFVYRYGGIGKTYVWKTLSVAIRSKGDIVLNVTSSGIASLFLRGERTAHSRFSIPLNAIENVTCSINQGSHLAELIVRTKLIIWDEALMMHKCCFEALDNALKDIMQLSNPLNKNKPFGGKTIVFRGDFRQILPVVPKGTRQDIVHATINSSRIWKNCKVLRLTKNMRLQCPDGSANELSDLREISEWIASIGDGTIGIQNDGYSNVEIPDDILLRCKADPIETIVQNTYPSFSNTVDDLGFLKDRAILAPTLDVVDSVNEYITSKNSSDGIFEFG